jgi:hypothetical protein
MSSKSKSRSNRRSKRRGVPPARFVVSNYRRYPAPVTIPPKQGVMIQLRNHVFMSSDGTGTVAGIVPCNPNATLSSAFGSVALFPEWTNWAALFSSVKAVQLELVGKSRYVETKGDTPGDVIIASQFTVGTSFPSSYATAADNTDSQSWNLTDDTSGRGFYHAFSHKRSLAPSATNDPDPTGDAYIGCPGGIALFGNTLPVSTSLMSILVVGTYVVYVRS